MKENSRQALLGQACTMIIAPATAAPAIRYLGVKTTFQWSQRLAAVNNIINCFALNDCWLWLTPVFMALQHGGAAFDRVLAAEAKTCGVGEGEKEAATCNL